MKRCLIYQPCGIGDIIWIQPIVDKIIAEGYQVIYPVIDLYYDMVKTQICKNNLIWVKESDDFPLKQFYKTQQPYNQGDELYLPISYADRYIPSCSVMISKYYFTNTPISNWHKNIEITRNKDKESRIYDVYKIDKNKPFSLINLSFGTPPNHVTRNTNIDSKIDQKIIMSCEIDQANGISLFDWLDAIENANEIHTVETSICFLADKYAKTENLYMYERIRDGQPPIFYGLTNKLYRNKNWIYNL
jgi:hypothetical protein